MSSNKKRKLSSFVETKSDHGITPLAMYKD
jgi:hypothetical protein